MVRSLLLFIRKYRWPLLGTFIALTILYWKSLPRQLFDDPVSAVTEDRNGNLLSATIAADGQWRFPESDEVPDKFKQALIAFEDKRFYRHIGVDALALGRAMVQNVKRGRVVSGGSTITMQVIRLSRKGKPRNIFQKVTEMVLATRLELRSSKDDILAMYASHAPFGGNVVGLEAASWRYFGKNPDNLSWAEAACLAVLPNSPALVTPGRNRQVLRQKRDDLLRRMESQGILNSTTLELALSESLPFRPHALPQLAMHLHHRATAEGRTHNGVLQTTLDATIQQRMNEIIERHGRRLSDNGIHNAAAIVVEVETGAVVAYVGNTSGDGHQEYGYDVDIITSPRSTGSILKPFLYSSMLHDGALLPNALVPDIPTKYGSFTPTNFNRDYDGAVPASQALARSLNVPAVRMLLDYGQERFYQRLKQFGITSLPKPASHYGLSLILGGAEASLWDIVKVYASMARTLKHYPDWDGTYSASDWRNLTFEKSDIIPDPKLQPQPSVISAGAIWHTFSAMVEVNRPDEQTSWRAFGNAQRIAWKTGTSYGHRDAWAVGVTPRYVVGVWAGNASGEGRPGLTGVDAAAPILFEIFNGLRSAGWFQKPFDDLVEVSVCAVSGYRAGEYCAETKSALVPPAGRFSRACPFHHIVHLDREERYRVTGACTSVDEMVHASWFVLPPAMEVYYRKRHPEYRPLPPFGDDCAVASETLRSIELIYPKLESNIYVPVALDGTPQKTVFEAAHRRPSAKVYWHLDTEFVGVTQGIHQLALRPQPGHHVLVLTDESGERIVQEFAVLEKRR